MTSTIQLNIDQTAWTVHLDAQSEYSANDRLIANRSALTAAQSALLSRLDLAGNHLNTPAPDGKWSVGQVIEHLWKTDIKLVRLFQLTPKVSRIPGGMWLIARFATTAAWLGGQRFITPEGERQLRKPWQQLRGADEPGRFVASQALAPSSVPLDANQLRSRLTSVHEKLGHSIDQIDVSRFDRVYFEHPTLGNFSLMGWIAFIPVHITRHLNQIDRLLQGKS